MKTIALAQRAIRNLKIKALADLDASGKLELLDAINGALAMIHALAPPHASTTQAALSLAAPETVSIGVTVGSADFTVLAITEAAMYCTIRIEGDAVDNQITGDGSLLHPYAGTTGTKTATLYHDAVLVPELYSELLGNPVVLETGRPVLPYPGNTPFTYWRERPVAEPEYYILEANAANNNPIAPAVLRTNSLPGQAYRMSVKAKLAPQRVKMLDLLSETINVPMREEFIEPYLLPVIRGRLTASDLWGNPEAIAKTEGEAQAALDRYASQVPGYLGTPANQVGTPYGY